MNESMTEEEGKPSRSPQEAVSYLLVGVGMTTSQKESVAQKIARGSGRQSGEGFPSPRPGSYRGTDMEERAQSIWRPTGSKEREVRSGARASPPVAMG